MSTDDFSEKINTDKSTEPQTSNTATDQNKSKGKLSTTDSVKEAMNDATFENIVNEVIENTNTPDENAADPDPPVVDGSNKEEDTASNKNEKDSDAEEKEDNNDETNQNDGSHKDASPVQTAAEEEKKMMIIKIATIAGVATLGAIIAPFAVVGALGAVGFGTAGVAAGSIAAAIQSSVYGGAVASGSVFAICQSIGAAGLGIAGTTATAVGGGGIFAGIGAGLASLFNKSNEEDNDEKSGASNEEEKVGTSSNNSKCNKKTQTPAVNEISENVLASCNNVETDNTQRLKIADTEEKKPLPDAEKVVVSPESIGKLSKAE